MEKVSLTILDEQQFDKDYYIESIQNPYERVKHDFWLCSYHSIRKLFLESAEDNQITRSRILALAEEKITQLA